MLLGKNIFHEYEWLVFITLQTKMCVLKACTMYLALFTGFDMMALVVCPVMERTSILGTLHVHVGGSILTNYKFCDLCNRQFCVMSAVM